MKASIALGILVSVASVYGCSSDDNKTTPGGVQETGGGGGAAGSGTGGSTGGKGGSSTGGKGGGGGGGTTGGDGGAATGGKGGSGGDGTPDASTPDGSTPTDSGTPAACVTVQVTNPEWCHSGKLIETACPVGRVVHSLTTCAGAPFAGADPASYAHTYTLSPCTDTGCSNDGNHTLWRSVECCVPTAPTDAGSDAN